MLMLLIACPDLMAQRDEEEPDVRDMTTRERIFVGGSLGLQFGTVTSIIIAPQVGYRFTNRISAGVGGTYQYLNDRQFGRNFSTSIYGGSVFARYLVIPQAFVHGEYERLSLSSVRFEPGSERQRIWEDNYFLGPGYRRRLGANSYFNLMLLYNFTQSQVYYERYIFRFSIDVGL